MTSKRLLILVFLSLVSLIASLYSGVTYIDATIYNSTFNEAPLVLGVNYTSSGSGGPNHDNQWHLRTSLRTNGAGVWATGATNGLKEGPELYTLATTFDLPEEGRYNIFGYFWIGGNGSAAWEAQFELGNALGNARTYSNVNSTNIALLSKASDYFKEASVRYDAVYDMFEASLGVWDTSVDGLTVTVYVDNGSGAVGADRRTWYDGVGYSVVQ